MKRSISKETLSEWGLPHDMVDPGKIISDSISETSRWSEHHDLIIQAPDDGKFYSLFYSQGLTEYQDESPWEYDTEVEATEVAPFEVMVTKYLPVEG